MNLTIWANTKPIINFFVLTMANIGQNVGAWTEPVRRFGATATRAKIRGQQNRKKELAKKSMTENVSITAYCVEYAIQSAPAMELTHNEDRVTVKNGRMRYFNSVSKNAGARNESPRVTRR